MITFRDVVVRNCRAYNSETNKFDGEYTHPNRFIVVSTENGMCAICKLEKPHTVIHMTYERLNKLFDKDWKYELM